MTCSRRIALLASCALACSRAQVAEPHPTGITPVAALTPQDVPITIHGSGFSLLASRQLGQGIRVDGVFQAWLGTTALTNVIWVDDSTLQAVVPAGTVGIPLDLIVQGPSGTATLGAAFRAAVTGPILRAVPRALPATVSIGQSFSVAVDVYNDGDSDALAVQLGAPASPNAAANGAAASAQDIPAGQVRTFTWPMIATAGGPLNFSSSGSGTDTVLGAAVAVSVQWSSSVVQTPPVLVVTSFTLRSAWNSTIINSGQPFTATLVISNTGGATASSVTPALPSSIATGGAAATAFTFPKSRSISSGGSATFTWSYVENGTAPGTLSLSTSASGTDANSGAAVTLSSAISDVLTVQSPPLLGATISAPATVLSGQSFSVTMSVTNGGQAAVNAFAPVSFSITGAPATASSPSPTSATLPGGGQVTFTWTCVASSGGAITVSATAAGSDANDGSTRSVDATTSATVAEISRIASDPFADGTPFAQVFDFNGRVYLGPKKTGDGAVRMLPDGSAPESVSFSIVADTGSLKSQNSSPAPYPSFGYTGCTSNTAQCGPDNENGRGMFTSGIVTGTPWLVGVGARTAGNLTHVYMSSDTGTAPSFEYIGMGKVMSSEMQTASAIAIFHDRLYLGVLSNKGNRPFLTAIGRMPTAPGYDASAIDEVDLAATRMPGIGVGAPTNNRNNAPVQMIDALFAFNDLLYLGNNGGWIRSTNNNPASYNSSTTDWAVTTPSDPAYVAKTSVTTSKLADLTPADRALVAMASFGGRLYAARNTTAGPQLWVCTPSAVGTCDPANWSMLAPNTTGDLQLSQFNDPTNTAVSLLAATSAHLYVGFDNAGGVRLYETTTSTPAALSDFAGQAGCVPTAACQGLGGNGLGAGATHFYDARALTWNAQDFLYLTAGTGSAGVGVFRTGG